MKFFKHSVDVHLFSNCCVWESALSPGRSDHFIWHYSVAGTDAITYRISGAVSSNSRPLCWQAQDEGVVFELQLLEASVTAHST